MSKFIDEISIIVQAGKGGAGSVHFHSEKFVEFGGPDGGDGGKGGDVYLQAESALSTLDRYLPDTVYKAPDGDPGAGQNRSGKDAGDLILKVPVGTEVLDSETQEVIYDFVQNQEKFCIAKGGRGGKGNTFFKSSTHQTPRFAQPGEEGEARSIKLNLKLIADIGIVGLPNAGKSTLLSKITQAHPKIAGYAFTTLIPNLGVVVRDGDRYRYTIADIPGIVEGASKGYGLGLSFLRHIERVKGVLYLLDGSSLSIQEEFQMLQKELESYNPILLQKPFLVVLNKKDIWDDDEFTKELKNKYKNLGKLIVISAEFELGLDELLNTIDETFFHEQIQ